MFSTVVTQFIHNCVFIIAIFAIRHVDDKFNISRELRKVCLFTTVLFSLNTSALLFFEGTIFVKLGLS
jgi:hypothetical protein